MVASYSANRGNTDCQCNPVPRLFITRKEVVIAMTSHIYKITNKINNKIYIGKTDNPERRWKSHINCHKRYKDRYLYRAMNKYGIENFDFELIHENIDNSDIDFYEKKYIVEYNSKIPNGYNMTDGGEGSIGRKMKESTKEKIRKASMDRTLTEESKSKMSQAQKKRFSNEEERLKMSEILKGHKKKSNQGYLDYWENVPKEEKDIKLNNLRESRIVSVSMLDLETKVEIKSFDSVRGAALWIRNNTKYHKAGHQNISKACKGKINYVYGYKWEYK